MLSFLAHRYCFNPEAEPLYDEIRKWRRGDLEDQTVDGLYSPPFGLFHGDFDGQNILFAQTDPCQPPKLSGIIDWDFSFAGPAYYLYEYPIFLRDVDGDRPFQEDIYAENKILRKYSVREVAQRFAKGSVDREDVKEAFRKKILAYNVFRSIFVSSKFQSAELELAHVERFANGLKGEGLMLFSYGGRTDWEPDSELESTDGAEGAGD